MKLPPRFPSLGLRQPSAETRRVLFALRDRLGLPDFPRLYPGTTPMLIDEKALWKVSSSQLLGFDDPPLPPSTFCIAVTGVLKGCWSLRRHEEGGWLLCTSAAPLVGWRPLAVFFFGPFPRTV